MGNNIKKPKIICLCGSTKYKILFEEWNKNLTLQGNIVLSVGLFGKTKNDTGKENNFSITDKQKIMLDELHKRKIDLSDEIFVINKNGYIGESTRSEIEYAKKHNKIVSYLEKELSNG